MTTESSHNDPNVSETYRSIATETTPPELDRKILSMAAAEPRSRYGLARAWIRPVAWAATIGLSLAFMLEMTQFMDAEIPATEAGRVESLDEQIVQDEAPAARKAISPPATSVPAADEDAELETDSDSVSADFKANDLTMMHEAEEQARVRSGSERAAAPEETLRFDAALTLEKKEKVEFCGQDARLSAATWYACIEELRHNGLPDAADQELASLLVEFPDFVEPEQNR